MFINASKTNRRLSKQIMVNAVCAVLGMSVFATLPGVVAAQDMSGFYGGVTVGREIGKDAPKKQDEPFGAFAGYNFDMGTALVGAEFGYNVGRDEALERPMHLKGRVGLPVAGGLLYGTAGMARADAEAGGTAKGTVFGVGYDYLIGENIILGAEFLRSQYKDVGPADVDVESNSVSLRAGFRF